MGFFSRFFSRTKHDTRPIQEIKQEAAIKYHPELIDELKEDHQALFGLYGEMIEMINQGKYSDLGPRLHDFKLALEGHLLIENIKFYVYVENKLSDDPMNLEFIKDVRKEMNSIARIVIKFTKKYEHVVFTEELKRSFVKELNGIGAVLTKRVEMEESRLYTLYTP